MKYNKVENFKNFLSFNLEIFVRKLMTDINNVNPNLMQKLQSQPELVAAEH